MVVNRKRCEQGGELEWPHRRPCRQTESRHITSFSFNLESGRRQNYSVFRLPMIHEAGTRISTVTPYDGVMGQSTDGRLQRIRSIIGTSAGAFRVEARHRVHTFVTPVSGMIIAAGLGPLVTETAAALVPLVATLGSFVAEGTRYTLGTFVTALRSLVTNETTPRFGAFVRKHARAGAISLVPTSGRHLSIIYLFFFFFRPSYVLFRILLRIYR